MDTAFHRQVGSRSLPYLFASLTRLASAAISVAWLFVAPNASLVELTTIGLINSFSESLKCMLQRFTIADSDFCWHSQRLYG